MIDNMRKKRGEEWEQISSAEKYMPAAPQLDESEKTTIQLNDELREREEGFYAFFHINSSEYKEVKNSSEELARFMLTHNIDAANPEASLELVNSMYSRLIRGCDTYLRLRQGHRRTDLGDRRQQIIQSLYIQSTEEQKKLNSNYGRLLEQARSGETVGWRDALADVRTLELSPKDQTEYEIKGGGSSSPVEIKTARNAGFFKSKQVNKPLVAMTLDIINDPESIRSQYPDVAIDDEVIELARVLLGNEYIVDAAGMMSDQLKVDYISAKDAASKEQVLKAAAQKFKLTVDIPDIVKTRLDVMGLQDAYNAINGANASAFACILREVGKLHTSGEVCDAAHIEKGRELSIRNVATSRMSSLLGEDSLIAHSSIAKLHLPGGETRDGAHMETAHGEELSKLPKADILRLKPTPEFVRQLSKLQVLDYICGQVDRNVSNYLLKLDRREDAIYITGLTGIDNDFSFGTLTGDPTRMVQQRMPLRDRAGNSELPVFDHSFANSILSLSPQMIAYEFGDILEKDELTALMSRVRDVWQTLLHDENRTDFLKDGGWDEHDTALVAASNSYFANFTHSVNLLRH